MLFKYGVPKKYIGFSPNTVHTPGYMILEKSGRICHSSIIVPSAPRPGRQLSHSTPNQPLFGKVGSDHLGFP
jgi:hypothetical protein